MSLFLNRKTVTPPLTPLSNKNARPTLMKVFVHAPPLSPARALHPLPLPINSYLENSHGICYRVTFVMTFRRSVGSVVSKMHTTEKLIK